MTQSYTSVEFEAVICDPAKYFKNPTDVLVDPNFNDTEKLRILEEWKLDLEQLAVAADENMTGGESGSLLGQVVSAMNVLQQKASSNSTL